MNEPEERKRRVETLRSRVLLLDGDTRLTWAERTKARMELYGQIGELVKDHVHEPDPPIREATATVVGHSQGDSNDALNVYVNDHQKETARIKGISAITGKHHKRGTDG